MQGLGAAILIAHLIFVRKLAARMPGASRLTVLGATLLVAFYYPLVNWTLQGMEVGLLALITSAGAWLLLRDDPDPRLAYVILGAGTLVRMDYVTVLLAAAAALALLEPARRRRHLGWAMGAAGAFLAVQEIARVLYFHDPLPNTYYLKLTGYPLGLRLARGGWVLLTFLGRTWGAPVLLAAAAARLVPRRDPRAALPLAIFGAQALYSVWVGGDAWEESCLCNRYITIAMPLLIVAGVWGIVRAAERLPLPRSASGAAAGALVLAFALALSPPARLLLAAPPPYIAENSEFVARALGARNVTTPEGTVAAAAAGAIGYFSDRHVVDLLGKNDPGIARLPMHQAPPGENPLTYFLPGHLKWDSAYSIGERRPDVVTQLWRFEPEARPYLERDYVLGLVPAGEREIGLALRKDSERIVPAAVLRVSAPRPGRHLKWRF